MKKFLRVLLYFGLVLFVFLLPFSVNYDENTFDKLIENTFPVIKEEVKNEEDLDYFQKKYQNSDIVARVFVDGSSINEPVVQTKDNDFYLNHDLFKRKDNRGSAFLDYRVNLSSRKKLIFGHNSSTLEVPFKELEKYYEYDYFKKHQIIELEWEERLEKYQIFSVFIETSDWSYMKLKFDTEQLWFDHISKLKNNSFYDTGVDVVSTDEILILQTCSHHKDYKKYKKKYLLIVAKKIKEN